MTLHTASKHLVLTTTGSLGDLHPYLALGLGLLARGHRVTVATHARYREKVQALGLGFHEVRPDFPNEAELPELIKQVMDSRTGTETVIRKWVFPHLRDSYEDTLAACRHADLVLSHPLTMTVRLVAEKLQLRWASSLLQPIGFMSAYDPPVFLPTLGKLRFLGRWFHRPLFGFMKWFVRGWVEPWHQLRAELGLPAVKENPLFSGQHAPELVLAMFSSALAAKQPDWPAQTCVTGFPFFDEAVDTPLAPELAEFLSAGPPPIVFTLGSSAVMDAGTFYRESTLAAQQLGARALLLIGSDPRNRQESLPAGVLQWDYAPYAKVFPQASVIVHQGGVGTTGQAMRAGKPMLVMPYAHDQPDNAARMVRLGIGRTIGRTQYTASRAVAELQPLLHEPSYREKASAIGNQVRQENGVLAACLALEQLLGQHDGSQRSG